MPDKSALLETPMPVPPGLAATLRLLGPRTVERRPRCGRRPRQGRFPQPDLPRTSAHARGRLWSHTSSSARVRSPRVLGCPSWHEPLCASGHFRGECMEPTLRQVRAHPASTGGLGFNAPCAQATGDNTRRAVTSRGWAQRIRGPTAPTRKVSGSSTAHGRGGCIPARTSDPWRDRCRLTTPFSCIILPQFAAVADLIAQPQKPIFPVVH